MPASSRIADVAEHYDELSPWYRELWGEHIHHGYYERGDESRREATERLVELLLEGLELEPAARVLDVGCGIGGTSRYVARRHACAVVGVTLSEVQARMAAAASGPGSERFVVGDAAALPLSGPFEAVIAAEVLSHVESRAAFFAETGRLLVEGGRLGIAAWLKSSELSEAEERRMIRPIERGMLVSLPTREEYEHLVGAAGLSIAGYRDISVEVARTWDLCLEIVADPGLWRLAARKGRRFLEFVSSFRAMQRGFRRGAFRYALIFASR